MSSFVNKFDKPHIPVLNYEVGKKTEMFNAVLSLDTHEILRCNLMYKIPFTIFDDDENSLIHILLNSPTKSSESSKLSVLRFLINNGVNPDKPNKYNVTPLHIACQQQLYKIVKYLLENYIGINKTAIQKLRKDANKSRWTAYVKGFPSYLIQQKMITTVNKFEE